MDEDNCAGIADVNKTDLVFEEVLCEDDLLGENEERTEPSTAKNF